MKTWEKALTGAAVIGGLYYVLANKAKGVSVEEADWIMMLYAVNMITSGVEYGVDPALIASVMTIESRGKWDAVGTSGEIGLMQVLPSTALWIAGISAEDLKKPALNIRTGTRYLRYCIDRKGGNVPAGIAGYNYGPDRVIVDGAKVIAPKSVISYMTNVLSLIEKYRKVFIQTQGLFYTMGFGDGDLILNGLNCRSCMAY